MATPQESMMSHYSLLATLNKCMWISPETFVRFTDPRLNWLVPYLSNNFLLVNKSSYHSFSLISASASIDALYRQCCSVELHYGTLLIGYHYVARKTGSRFVPTNSPIRQFDMTLAQSLAQTPNCLINVTVPFLDWHQEFLWLWKVGWTCKR